MILSIFYFFDDTMCLCEALLLLLCPYAVDSFYIMSPQIVAIIVHALIFWFA